MVKRPIYTPWNFLHSRDKENERGKDKLSNKVGIRGRVWGVCTYKRNKTFPVTALPLKRGATRAIKTVKNDNHDMSKAHHPQTTW